MKPKPLVQEAHSHGFNSAFFHLYLYAVDFLQHDAAAMQREAAGVMGTPGFEHVMLFVQSNTAAYGGQFAKARELARRAAESAQRADEKEVVAGYQARAALREALVGNVTLAKQQAQAGLALSDGRDVEALLALVLGLAGDEGQARRLANNLSERFAENTVVQFNYLPTIRAAVALQGHDAGKAIEVLEPALPYELGQTALTPHPIYVRGQAYLATHQGPAAVAEFQKILDHPGLVTNSTIGALAHLQLGRAYALQGDTAKAKAAYQDFLTLWKDADPDIPILKQAKAEYAKLQ